MTAFSSSLLETFVPELASLNPVSRYWAKLRRGISDFQISGQSHNSRTSGDNETELGPVTKLGKRNKQRQNIDDDVMSANRDVVLNFPIYGQFGAVRSYRFWMHSM